MRGAWSSLVAAAVALGACGGGPVDVEASEPLEARTLTIVDPLHGETVESPASIAVAETGPGALAGEPSPTLSVLVDDVEALRTDAHEFELPLSEGPHWIRVEGVGPDGEPLPEVTGDRILVVVAPAEDPAPSGPGKPRFPGLPGGPGTPPPGPPEGPPTPGLP